MSFWKATQSPCPNHGCGHIVTHDSEDEAQPCSDGCWFQIGLRELLTARAASLTEDELHDILQGTLEEQPHLDAAP